MIETIKQQTADILQIVIHCGLALIALAIGVLIFIKEILPILKETLLYKEETKWTDPREYDKERNKAEKYR